jgi:hypothetical protein
MVFVPSVVTASNKPVTGIDVIVKKLPCPCSSARQTATPNKDGSFSVNLPGAGKYTITYADGPKKGQVITTITATKAGKTGIQAQISATQ